MTILWFNVFKFDGFVGFLGHNFWVCEFLQLVEKRERVVNWREGEKNTELKIKKGGEKERKL